MRGIGQFWRSSPPGCRRCPWVTGIAAGAAALLGVFGQPIRCRSPTCAAGLVDLCGASIYRYDSVFSGAGNRGTDAVTLFIALPLLVTAVLGYRRGPLRWQLVLTGALAYFLYVSVSMAAGAAFNAVFPVYVSAFAASLWGFVLSVGSVDRNRLAGVVQVFGTAPAAVGRCPA